MTDSTLRMTGREKEAINEARRARILALPAWTLIRVGWEIEPGRVQGGVHFRIGDGLGPVGRDDSAASVLRSAVQGLYEGSQQWGFEVLASPATEVAPLCGCGLRQSRNPHPDAGKPNEAGVAVGYMWECIPCLVKTRNRVGKAWRAEQAETKRLRDAMREAARSLYAIEVHRQLAGWDDDLTARLVAAQHALAAVTIAAVPTDDRVVLEPIEGEHVDELGDEQSETHWRIRGPWKVVGEGEQGIVIAPDHRARR